MPDHPTSTSNKVVNIRTRRPFHPAPRAVEPPATELEKFAQNNEPDDFKHRMLVRSDRVRLCDAPGDLRSVARQFTRDNAQGSGLRSVRQAWLHARRNPGQDTLTKQAKRLRIFPALTESKPGLSFCFDAFSSREPAASLENALALRLSVFNFQIDGSEARKANRCRGARRQVDDTTFDKGTAIIDANDHRLPVSFVGDANLGSEWKAPVRRGQALRPGKFPAGCFSPAYP